MWLMKYGINDVNYCDLTSTFIFQIFHIYYLYMDTTQTPHTPSVNDQISYTQEKYIWIRIHQRRSKPCPLRTCYDASFVGTLRSMLFWGVCLSKMHRIAVYPFDMRTLIYLSLLRTSSRAYFFRLSGACSGWKYAKGDEFMLTGGRIYMAPLVHVMSVVPSPCEQSKGEAGLDRRPLWRASAVYFDNLLANYIVWSFGYV